MGADGNKIPNTKVTEEKGTRIRYAGIYARISVEHCNKKDITIENQILLARQWLGMQSHWVERQCYIDQGFSGTSFRRPAFLSMLEDVKKERIQCIIVKDLSRLGRNYLETGEYLEKIFPCMGVRVVSLGDGYDSEKGQPGSLEYGIRNVMNEWYAKDIGRKVHLAKQQQKKQGYYLGNQPPYGYKIVWSGGKRVLQKDQRVFWVVEAIQRLRRQGNTWREIQRWLSERNIATPLVFRRCGNVYCESGEADRKQWDEKTLRRLSNTRGDNDPA